MTIRVKLVIVSRMAGASVSTVSSARMRRTPTQSASPPPTASSTRGSDSGLTGPAGGCSGGWPCAQAAAQIRSVASPTRVAMSVRVRIDGYLEPVKKGAFGVSERFAQERVQAP